ncbi:helix-turn-helix domain-containing protein [Vibrio splendidus]|uniref:helix-turn-helix domain-containing protein n=1 Tax=Vibrio splendidus TaxID=29497 RepID=UPI000A9421DC|nr:helix-turn-helix domain-containing protein [Vibrio splendidus]URM15083.1 helix-turn-helix domain-containing protein [Vibrio splendidus]
MKKRRKAQSGKVPVNADQKRTYRETTEAMGIRRTTLESWVRQLRAERARKLPNASPIIWDHR